MDRFQIVEKLIERASGVTVDGCAVWDDIQQAAANSPEDGDIWLTGRDDVQEMWQFYVSKHTVFDEETDCYETDIRLHEIKITPRTGSSFSAPVHIKLDGAEVC